MDNLISKKAAIAEIARWIGYIDEDMINRIQIGLNRLPSAQPETHDKRTKTHSCDYISRQAAIDSIEKHLRFGDELYPLTDTDKVLNHGFEIAASCVYNLPSAQPDLEEAYICGETEAEARYHAQQRWIPCSERLPEERQEILATTTDNAWGDVVIIRTYYKEMHKSVIAWMPLPEPYREEGNE